MRCRLPNLLQSHAGFALVEVTIASAIALIVAVGMYSTIVEMNKNVAAAQVKMEAAYFYEDIRNALKTSTSCLATFTGKSFAYSSAGVTPWQSSTLITSDAGDTQRITQIINVWAGGSEVLFDVTNPNLKSTTAKLERMTLGSYTPSVSPTSVTDPNFYSGRAILNLTFNAKSSAVRVTLKPKSMNLLVNLMKCSSCPSGANCDAECAGLTSNDKKIKSCTYDSGSGGSGGSSYGPSITISGSSVNWPRGILCTASGQISPPVLLTLAGIPATASSTVPVKYSSAGLQCLAPNMSGGSDIPIPCEASFNSVTGAFISATQTYISSYYYICNTTAITTQTQAP